MGFGCLLTGDGFYSVDVREECFYLSMREIDNLLGAEQGCPVVCVPCNPSRVALFSLVKLYLSIRKRETFCSYGDSHS